jgi:membrane protease YdiL (CAAX protease family)
MSDEPTQLPPEPEGPAPELSPEPQPEAHPSHMDARSLLKTTVVLYGGLSVVAVVWGLLDGWRNVYFHPAQQGSWISLPGIAVGLAAGLAVVVLSRLTVNWFSWARALHREFHDLLRGVTTGQALVLALASAVGEEALFRGAALPTVGLFWSSVLFGVAHVPVRRGLWPWPLMAFGMGLALGWMFLRFGDLTGPILAHATINFLNLRYIAQNSLDS